MRLVEAVIRNWTSKEYHQQASLSRSRLWEFYKSARKHKAISDGEVEGTKETEAMRLGSLVHALCFEPDHVSEFVAIPPSLLSIDGKATTKAAAQFIESHAGRTVVTQSSWDTAHAVYRRLMHGHFGKWLAAAEVYKELSIEWPDIETGLLLRCRVDMLVVSANGLFVADLKTCQDASPSEFRYSIKKYGYWLQYAMYCDGIEAATGVRPTEWYFVAAATNPPHEIGYHHLGIRTKVAAVERFRSTLGKYAEAVQTGVWRSEWDEQINCIELSDYDF